MTAPHNSPTQNHLLASLPKAEFDRLSEHLELVEMTLGDTLYESHGRLKRDGLIRYSRGRITLLDRPGLEETVCECYDVVKKEYERLITDIPKHDPLHVLGPSSG